MSMNQQKKLLFQKTNHHASIRILFLMALLICNGYQIYLDNTYQIIFILFQGLLLVSLFAISLYITIRFDKKYALFALLALFHDLFIVFGIFSWLGIILSVEVNSLFAVSLLTIAGYSVNDTVVIFDRIRENLKSKKEGYNETIQLSVNESFRRTTFTSITTLIPLLSIILFGSYSLFWFSLALSLGIIVGSYSSILLAPSLLLKD